MNTVCTILIAVAGAIGALLRIGGYKTAAIWFGVFPIFTTLKVSIADGIREV